jgi:acyl-CoA synthetase (AMP-forming)/AMP-acid ligase II
MTATAPTPFDTSGVTRGSDGIARYDALPPSLVHMLRAQVEADATAEAVVEVGGGRLTYRQMWDRAARVAGGLRASGVRPGDRVAIRLPNGVDWVLAFWGAQLAGAVAVPVNTRFTESEARYVIEDSDARHVIEPDAPLPDGTPSATAEVSVEDAAAIFYTSGTTGFPKGAVTTHANFLSNCESCNRVRPVRTELPPRTLISVPLFHVTGCNSQLLTATYLGGTSVVLPQFEVTSFLATIERERVDWVTSVPAIHWLAINHPDFPRVDVSGVRMLSYGGAPIAPELVAKIKKAFPAAWVGNGFGLTETSSLSTFLPHEYAAEHADSVGFPVPVCDVRLAVLDDATSAGELLIRGPHVVRGYWNRPEATAATFVNGWLHTGDLARIDEQGLLYIVDRAKDMINRGGENVYCVEVENALAGAPGVFEAAVVGVPDEVMGEKVGAVVVPAPGVTFDVPAMLDHLRERLADFKVPQYVAVRTEPLPRNPGGKILKNPLRRKTEWGQPVR